MTKAEILKKEGLTEDQFYKLYPTREAYLMKCGGNMAQLGQQIPAPVDYGYALLMQEGGVPSYNFPALMDPDVTDSMIYEQHFKNRYNNNPSAINEHEKFKKYGVSLDAGRETYIAANMWRNAYDDAVKQQNLDKQKQLIKNGIETGIINYNQKAFPGQPLKQLGGECPECEEAKNGKWIQEDISIKQLGGMPKAQVGTSIDSLRHQAGNMFDYEAKKGCYDEKTGKAIPCDNFGYNESQLPWNQIPTNWKKPTSKLEAINLYMQETAPKLKYWNSAMEKGEAGDFFSNTGRDPRVYQLDQYLKSIGQSGIPNRTLYNVDTKTPEWTPELQKSLDEQWNKYSPAINKLPENERRILMNKGRDFYYQNIDKVNGKPNPAYPATWGPRIWESVNEYKHGGSLPHAQNGLQPGLDLGYHPNFSQSPYAKPFNQDQLKTYRENLVKEKPELYNALKDSPIGVTEPPIETDYTPEMIAASFIPAANFAGKFSGLKNFAADALTGTMRSPSSYTHNLDKDLSKNIVGGWDITEQSSGITGKELRKIVDTQLDYLDSPEYLAKRSKNTGESIENIKKDIELYKTNLNKGHINFEEFNSNIRGSQLDSRININTTNADKSLIENTIHHEINHALSPIYEGTRSLFGWTLPGQNSVKKYKNFPLLDMGKDRSLVFPDYKYQMKPWEQQVRLNKLKLYMQDNYGKKMGTDFDDYDLAALLTDHNTGYMGKTKKYIDGQAFMQRAANVFKPSEQFPNFTDALKYSLNNSWGLTPIVVGTAISANSNKKSGGQMNNLFPMQMVMDYDCPECEKLMAKDGKWIQNAHLEKGRCTPGSPNYDCPKGSPQWNLAQTFKKHHGFHKKQDGGDIIPDTQYSSQPKHEITNKTIPGQDSSDFFKTRQLQLTDFLHKSAQPAFQSDIMKSAHGEFMSQFQPQMQTGMPAAQDGSQIQAWQNWYANQPLPPTQQFQDMNQPIDLYGQSDMNNYTGSNSYQAPRNLPVFQNTFTRNLTPNFPNNKLNTGSPQPNPNMVSQPVTQTPFSRDMTPDFPKNQLNSSNQTLDKYMNPGLTTDYYQNQKNKTAQAGTKGMTGNFDWMGLVNMINTGVGTMAQQGEFRKEEAWRRAHRPKPEDWSAIFQSNRGDYTDGARFSGSNFRPNQTQYGMYGPIAKSGGQMNYREGDEVEMDEETMREFLANGGQIEMLM